MIDFLSIDNFVSNSSTATVHFKSNFESNFNCLVDNDAKVLKIVYEAQIDLTESVSEDQTVLCDGLLPAENYLVKAENCEHTPLPLKTG